MEHVLISGCNFYEVDDEKYRARGFYPAWFLTLGQSNDNRTDVRMENCVIRVKRCNTLFRMVGNATHTVVDNCDLYLEQPDDMEKRMHPRVQIPCWPWAMTARMAARSFRTAASA